MITEHCIPTNGNPVKISLLLIIEKHYVRARYNQVQLQPMDGSSCICTKKNGEVRLCGEVLIIGS